MIKFFRKIRQNLLSEGKTEKYLKYAIGEIILVVLGLLIALSINNWNENRKEKIIENELLTLFKNDLKEDMSNINLIINSNIKTIKSCEIIVSNLKNKLPYNDSLAIHFDDWISINPLSLNKTAYTNLTSRGPELISNLELRYEILKLYNTTYDEAITLNNFFIEDFHNALMPIQLQNVEAVK